jgi:hypothetical protein
MRFSLKITAPALLSVAAIFFSAIPSTSANPPKSGALCSKAGLTKNYQGKKYTCVKSGKKLVWNKGVLVKKAAPKTTESSQPAPTPTLTPSPQAKEVFTSWSTKFTTQVMFEKAYENFVTWSRAQLSSQKKHQLVMQDVTNGFASALIQDLKTLDDFASGIFSQYMKSKSVTVLGFDENWVISQINGTGGHLRNMQGRCNEPYLPYLACMNRDSHVGIVIVSDCKNPQNVASNCQLHLLPHEYFHIIQLNAADNIQGSHWNFGDENSKNSFPHWLVEGSADFVSTAIASFTRDAKYESTRFSILSGAPMRNALVDYEIYRPNNSAGDNLNSYNIGHIATEYIVASIGFQKFMDIWKDFAVTRNFYNSFERVTGRSVDAFYADFERARESLGIPPVTQKR